MKWVSLLGSFSEMEDGIVFHGGAARPPEAAANVGNFVTDEYFQGGSISAVVEFLEDASIAGCEFILQYDPQSQSFLTAGINPFSLSTVRTFSSISAQSAQSFGAAGDRTQLQPNRPYALEVTLSGSSVSVFLDEVNLLTAQIARTLPNRQAGIWCLGNHDIRVSKFSIIKHAPRVFVVMQFSPPYNELYTEVIRPVCEEFGFEVIRADEIYGPGLIVADIEQNISTASVIIADVTPVNANVYYELGFAHALRKQTILVAERETRLPFDISPFRTLFYENSIGGKAKVEAGLRSHLRAIQQTAG